MCDMGKSSHLDHSTKPQLIFPHLQLTYLVTNNSSRLGIRTTLLIRRSSGHDLRIQGGCNGNRSG